MLKKHERVEKNSMLMLILVVIVVSIGGIIEILPLFRMETTIEPVKGVRPYTPLEVAGRNVYIREGCYNCHSQQIRALRDEVERYGHYSLAAESMYDHPFQWGSKRTGPDLARVGGKYSDEWHVQHMHNPKDVVPESIMPPYAHLAHKGAKLDNIEADIRALRAAGVPYTDEMVANAYNDAMAQAQDESDHHDGLLERYGDKVNYRNFDGQAVTTELDALIAYLQVLGTMAELKDYVHDGAARSGQEEDGK
ncbi:cytochrome-c oxidase, cbb3-type subunit II [Kordiimonas aestuarii]|uniref:cytochrome-c oxidase, cbb3-type subunit II n=1 Tax=Kordiimonas aestuarii TaxID=1005925 RepID=UPI0021D02094|nr:cytochrome-c oxidase, cbb3-type subunit II [Kordiimonas aestuarii]